MLTGCARLNWLAAPFIASTVYVVSRKVAIAPLPCGHGHLSLVGLPMQRGGHNGAAAKCRAEPAGNRAMRLPVSNIQQDIGVARGGWIAPAGQVQTCKMLPDLYLHRGIFFQEGPKAGDGVLDRRHGNAIDSNFGARPEIRCHNERIAPLPRAGDPDDVAAIQAVAHGTQVESRAPDELETEGAALVQGGKAGTGVIACHLGSSAAYS